MSYPRRALMISYPFPPAMSAGVFRILRFCKYLPEFGWEPIVLTPRPEAVVPITFDYSLEALIPPGLEIHRTTVLRPVLRAKDSVRRMRNLVHSRPRPATSVRDGNDQGSRSESVAAPDEGVCPESHLKRALKSWEGRFLANPDRHIGWLLPAVQAGLKIVRRKRPDVIYSSGPPHSVHLIALALKRLTGLPIVLDFRDPWAAREWAANSRPTVQQRSAMRWEAKCVDAADRVVVNTTAVRRQFEATYDGSVSGKFAAIPNGLDADFARRIEQLLSKAPAPPDRAIRLCHAGSVYGRRDLRPLAKAIELIARRDGQDIAMEQIGPVDPHKAPSATIAGQNGGLQLLGSLPHEQTLEHMAKANILVMIQPDNTLQIPGKLYEMLPFRQPILTLTSPGATSEVVQEYGLGPVVDPKDPAAISDGIRWAASAAGREAVAQGMERAMEAFDGRTLTSRLAAEFASATKR